VRWHRLAFAATGVGNRVDGEGAYKVLLRFSATLKVRRERPKASQLRGANLTGLFRISPIIGLKNCYARLQADFARAPLWNSQRSEAAAVMPRLSPSRMSFEQ
jgi:hypothetical protein